MKIAHTIFALVLITSMLVGCTLLAPAAPSDPNPIYTQAAQTIAVTLTLGAAQAQLLASSTPLVLPEATATPEVLPTNTPAPTEAPAEPQATTTISTTLTTLAMVTATMNSNCRDYPSASGEYQSALLAGQTVELRGRLADNTWWYVEDPEESAKSCWVWGGSTEVKGDPKLALVISVPKTPVPSYTISGSVSPANYSGACPVDITVSGKIKATAGSDKDIQYGWTTNFGVSPAKGITEFDEAGTQTVSTTFQITEDTTGLIRFRLYKPVEMQTDRFKMVVDCD
jgi:hypothetical protein